MHELLELANKCQNDENHIIFVLIHLNLAFFVYFQKTYVFIIFLKPSSQLCLMNYFSFFLPINCQNHAAWAHLNRGPFKLGPDKVWINNLSHGSNEFLYFCVDVSESLSFSLSPNECAKLKRLLKLKRLKIMHQTTRNVHGKSIYIIDVLPYHTM